MSVYQEIILNHYKYPKNFGKITNPTNHTDLSNPLCGDKFTMHGIIRDGILADVKFSGEGCAISTASASLLTEASKGIKISVLKKRDKSFILKLLGVDLSPNRLKCALLPLELLQKMIVTPSNN